MSNLDFIVIVFLSSIVAGIFGSLLGLGGGALIVPVLTIFFHVNIRLAIGASIISVIATSSGAAAAYVKDKLTNLRVGMFLELGTTLGAVSGAFLTTVIPARLLFIIFAVVLLYSGLLLYFKRNSEGFISTTNDKIARRLNFGESYYDGSKKSVITYHVTRTRSGLFFMYIAGLISALLGIGSGALKVPVMDLLMKMPLKASSATSNFMIGVTAAASAGVYFIRGLVNPIISGPIALGVVLGSLFGPRVLGKIESKLLRAIFIVFLLIISIEMFRTGL